MATVIDVSEWQGWINWEQVKAAGCHAIIRCGYGSDYANQDDKHFLYNINECERLGIPHGVYLYSYATNEDMARSEAAHVLRLIAGRELQYPVYFDTEEAGTEYASYGCAVAFGDAIEAAGYWAGVYASASWWQNYLAGLDRFTKWVAHWGVSSPAVACDLWQYTSDGDIPGVDGRCDVSESFRDLPAAIAGNGGAEAATEPAEPIPAPRTIADVVNDLASQVLNGEWGNGDERKELLGFAYDAVQARVNELLGV